MNIEKLIESVRLCGSTPKVDQCKQWAYWSGGDMTAGVLTIPMSLILIFGKDEWI